MCLAIPGEITVINGDYALVNIMGAEAKIFIKLIEEPEIGDYVLIHVGCAIEKINKEYYGFLTENYNSFLGEDGFFNE
ncbi:HypC/HybG/HupF family hydrogenase formation chaperone [Alloiococcus sp. CFN-8]|uniref:HypC/HybG/HupF family hydrogenase formation chaperone n=1 Tax=Alloiococcus sp. CFN-8 TaxID=3416081 RepID=UPI003CEB388D